MSNVTKTCRVSGKEFVITEADQAFYNEKIALSVAGTLYPVSYPTLCPDERCRRRLAWQNMTHLYMRKCNATGKDVISNFSPDKSVIVYDNSYYWSDSWEPRDYGRDFDFSRPFFEQFAELLEIVPQPNLMANYMLDENSAYTNYAGNNKDCYLLFHADMNRDSMYGVGVKKCNDVVDILHTHGSELMYETVDCRNCYNVQYAQDCENCSDSWFLKNCLGCKHCFACVNLQQKQYCIYNKQYSQQEYEKYISEFQSGSYVVIEKMKKEFEAFQISQPQRELQGYQNEDCSGDRIYRCQNVKDSFDIQESRDVCYSHRIYNGPNYDVYDVNEYGMNIERVLEGLAIGINAQNVIAGIYVNEQVSNIYYSMHVHHAKNCFGCISLTRGEYCILNKQYTKEEYESLLLRIIEHMRETGEWGEFFPIKMSPFAYNETVANDYFPMQRDEVISMGWNWKEKDHKDYTIQNYTIPDNIVAVDDEITAKVLACRNTGRNFRITKQELDFYRQMKIPIPRLYFQERHGLRFQKQNPRHLWKRSCDKCGKEMDTSFAPEREEKVYCNECYLESVY